MLRKEYAAKNIKTISKIEQQYVENKTTITPSQTNLIYPISDRNIWDINPLEIANLYLGPPVTFDKFSFSKHFWVVCIIVKSLCPNMKLEYNQPLGYFCTWGC